MARFTCALNPEQRTRCMSCERGCCTLFEVLLTQTEAERLMALRLPGVPQEFNRCFAPSDQPGEVAVRRGEDGRCIFAEGRLCKIHNSPGMAAKPLSCRIFPLHIQHWADGGVSASYRFICPAVGRRDGNRLGDQLDEVAILSRQLGNRRGVNDCIYSASNPVPLVTVRKIHAGFRLLLRDETLPLAVRLYAAARILDFHDNEAMHQAIREADDSFATDLTAFVSRARPELENELRNGRADALVRSRFRSLLCGYLRDDRPEDAAFRRRLNRAKVHLRVFSGIGVLAELNPAAPHVSILCIPNIARRLPLTTEAVELFREFFYGKLDTMEFCGTQIQRFDYTTGLRHLLLAAPAALVLAAAFAADAGKNHVGFDAMHRAVRLIDFTFGRSPFFRLRLARGWIRKLTRPADFAGLLNSALPGAYDSDAGTEPESHPC